MHGRPEEISGQSINPPSYVMWKYPRFAGCGVYCVFDGHGGGPREPVKPGDIAMFSWRGSYVKLFGENEDLTDIMGNLSLACSGVAYNIQLFFVRVCVCVMWDFLLVHPKKRKTLALFSVISVTLLEKKESFSLASTGLEDEVWNCPFLFYGSWKKRLEAKK